MQTLNEALAALGAEVRKAAPVSGGDINDALCLTLTDGSRLFMKSNRGADPAFFEAEADGLRALRETLAIRAPEVIAVGRDPGCGSFLLMAWVDAAPRARDFWESFGRALAVMHRAPTLDRFGWTRDNHIGLTPQKNAQRDNWIDFFRDCRLAPQLQRARRWLDADARRRAERLMDRLGDLLIEPERPSLLHGDLWSGNFVTGSDGYAWLIDPAVYAGHAEADIAMTELFGGFHPRFYDAYREVNPLVPGYETRRDVYNLYHLLNHLNLFGGGYLSAVDHILHRYT